ncbi:MAG: fibronectin type III domain-containing protein, partial [Acidobacteriota bacterium]
MLPVLLSLFAAAALAQTAEVQATWSLDAINRIAADSRNVVLPILECKLDGFTNDWAAYRTASVRRSAERGRIAATVPAAGVFYPAFIFYDSGGDERIAIAVNGVERGVAVANVDDNRQRLFFLAEPVSLKAGDAIELRALTSQGAYRTEDLLLLREKPQPSRHEYAIREVFVEPQASSATLSWITNWPAACTIEVDGLKTIAEDLPLANHRVVLSDLQPGRSYRFRVTANTREGEPVASEWRTFQARPRPAVMGREKRARVPLRIEEA